MLRPTLKNLTLHPDKYVVGLATEALKALPGAIEGYKYLTYKEAETWTLDRLVRMLRHRMYDPPMSHTCQHWCRGVADGCSDSTHCQGVLMGNHWANGG